MCQTAFAANWTFFMRDDKVLNANIYIDADNVMKDGNSVFFEESIVYDQPNVFGDKKEIWLWEVKLLSPRSHRALGYYGYDADGHGTYQNGKPTEFYPIEPGSNEDNEIDMVLKYAKEW